MKQRVYPSVVSGVVVGAIGAAVVALIVANTVSIRTKESTLAAMYVAWVFFFMVGIGAIGKGIKWGWARRDLTQEEELGEAGKDQGVWRYFRFTTDHKVVGIQYLMTVFVLLLVGALAAFLIRLDQSQTGGSMFGHDFYNTLVGVHGTVMIAAVIIMVSSTFGNFIVPIMIGARDMAFPRLNALSYWFLFAAIPIFLSTLVLGGFPTGWTGYAPLADTAPPGGGMLAYSFTIIFFAISLSLGAINIVTTVITMRTKGMTWGRLPVFVWGVTLSVMLGLVAFPSFMVSQVLVVMDRVFGTSFFLAGLGGSNFLYEHLFWFMGHPEVYVIALPSIAAACEIATVFTRKRLFGYRLILGGMLGICSLSMLVWAHHLYFSGANTALNGPFMLATELISIPTGLIFLVMIGTFWRGRIWLTTPLLFVLGFLFNFIIGGVTGLFLADVPSDASFHGGMFVVAHFHFTLVGGMVFGFFGAVYYWFPKVFGRRLSPGLGIWHFWLFEIGFLGTFLSLFYAGLRGEPRWMADVPAVFGPPNVVASLFTIPLVLAVVVFATNVVRTLLIGEHADANEWGGKTLEWQVATPVPLENFEELPVVTSDPYPYGTSVDRTRVAAGTGLPAPAAE